MNTRYTLHFFSHVLQLNYGIKIKAYPVLAFCICLFKFGVINNGNFHIQEYHCHLEVVPTFRQTPSFDFEVAYSYFEVVHSYFEVVVACKATHIYNTLHSILHTYCTRGYTRRNPTEYLHTYYTIVTYTLHNTISFFHLFFLAFLNFLVCLD